MAKLNSYTPPTGVLNSPDSRSKLFPILVLNPSYGLITVPFVKCLYDDGGEIYAENMTGVRST